MKPNCIMSCTHCKQNSKYKCPVCRVPYCSVACYKEHKQNPCSPPPETPIQSSNTKQSEIEYEYPTEDTVSVEKLKLLAAYQPLEIYLCIDIFTEQSEEVNKCLENPHVRQILELLDQSPHPDRLMQEYMTEPIFTEFADACLKVVQPQDYND